MTFILYSNIFELVYGYKSAHFGGHFYFKKEADSWSKKITVF